jgi:SAM-dependent methyltransferase
MAAKCHACGFDQLNRVEKVSINSLAEAWANQKLHGPAVSSETIYEYIVADLQTTEVEFWKCAVCGLESASPMRSWSAAHYPNEIQELGFDHERALTHLAKLSKRRLLEIGCSDGRFLQRAARLGHETVGIDFSPAAVEASRDKGLDARLCNLRNIDSGLSKSDKFDVIAIFQVIEHLEEPNEFFSQILSFAAPNASLFVGCPSHLRFAKGFKHPERLGLSDFWDYPPQHTLRWTPNSLRALLQNHGWKVEAVEFEPFSLVGAASQMTALYGLDSGWYTRTNKRRFETIKWMGRLLGHRTFNPMTGIRLFVRATRA